TARRRQRCRLLPSIDADERGPSGRIVVRRWANDGGGSGRVVATAPGGRRLFFDVDQRTARRIGALGGRSHPVLEACNSGTPRVQRTCGLQDLQECWRSMWCVYLLRCADGTLYTGITNDLARRLAAHRAGRGARYTRGRSPLTLLHSECAPT